MNSYQRRRILIERMESLESQGMGCIGCKGTCCTFESNSMMLTPLEAVEIMDYLKDNKLLTAELKDKLLKAQAENRLENKPLQSNRRSYLRKTYTCPFFGHMELGCPLPREIKPYGCLAFDSHHETLKASEHCYSEIAILAKREEDHAEETKLNDELRTKYNLYWDKGPIPSALLDLWDKFI